MEIIGGLWGARPYLNRTLSSYIFNQLFDKKFSYEDSNESSNPYGGDQKFLKKVVYKSIRNISTIHDSYLCKKFKDSKPFPYRRVMPEFVGYDGDVREDEIDLCPKACRPSNHKNWKFC